MRKQHGADQGTYFGVDVGGSQIKWAVLAGATVEATGRVPTPRTGPSAVLDAIVALHREQSRGSAELAVAMPGLVDRTRGESILLPNLAGDWAGVAVGAELERRCGVPVALLNDARACAHAELRVGAARGRADVLFVVLGTGVGGALALDGEILMGQPDSVGEIGHQVIDPHGDLCGCGGRGCLETFASAPAVVSKVTRAVSTGQSAWLTRATGGRVELLDAEMVARAAAAGDPWARAAFERAGDAIGMSVVAACLLLQIPTVIVGGGLSAAFAHLIPSIERVLTERAAVLGQVSVRPAELGAHAGAIGAAMYAATGDKQRRDDDVAGSTEERTPTP